MNRRTILRGAGGVALALPLLEAAMPRRVRAATAPRRFLIWATPNGTVVDRWICQPAETPETLTLSEILSPLERHKADLVGVQNLRKFSGYGHEYATCLTGGRYKDIGYPKIYGTRVSLDQYLAKKWEGLSPLPYLHLGVQVTGDREASSCISWTDAPHQAVAGATQPVPAENNPFSVFSRLFGGTAQGAATATRAFSSKRSVLDSVLAQTSSLSQQLGKSDRAVVDNYLESVRGIEKQMTALDMRTGACTPPKIGADPTAAGATKAWWLDKANVAPIIKLWGDLIAAIFACDLTRMITLTVAGSGGSSRPPPPLPGLPPGDWHGVSHAVEKGNLDGLTAVEKWYYDRLAGVIDSLKATTDATGGSVLANSLVMTMNEYGPNGAVPAVGLAAVNNSHTVRMMPILLFGQLGGALKTGRWVVRPFTDAKQAYGPHVNQLFVSILNAFGIPDQAFGDPTAMRGPLPGVFI